MSYGELDRRVARPQDNTHRADVMPAIDADGRFAIAGTAGPRGAFAVEEALGARQEADEFTVVPFGERCGVIGELVSQPTPDRIVLVLQPLQQFPVILDLRPFLQWHQLKRPQQDLPKLPNHRLARISGIRRRKLD